MGGRRWRQEKKLKRVRTADLGDVGAEVQDVELPAAVAADCGAERSDFLDGEATGRAQVRSRRIHVGEIHRQQGKLGKASESNLTS